MARKKNSRIPRNPETTSATEEKKKRRWKSGTVALREIKRYQKSTGFLIRRASFRRLVKEILINMHVGPDRMTAGAVEALQEVSESLLVGMFEDCMVFAAHAKRVTVKLPDWKLARDMERRGKGNGC